VTTGGISRLQVTVLGRVQGVGFRYFVLEVARRLQLDGWVANATDGSVICVAEGPPAELQQLLAALNDGPAAADVRHVRSTWSPATGEFHGFGVRVGGHPGD